MVDCKYEVVENENTHKWGKLVNVNVEFKPDLIAV